MKEIRDSLAQVLASFEEVSDKPYLERLVNGERIHREAIAWLRKHGPELMKMLDRHGAGDADRSAELTTAWMAGAERERERAARDAEDVNRRALIWFAGRDSGMSSQAIARHMLGMESDGSIPLDPGDLGRCLRMLELFPEWKARMVEMTAYSPQWERLYSVWGELERLMEEETAGRWRSYRARGSSPAPKTYALMEAARAGERG